MVQPSNPLKTPNFAVIFRTHFWDDFAQRQFDRLLSQVEKGHVFVLVDETNGRVEGIRHDRVVRLAEQDVIDMGFPRAGTGNMLWFNGDYPLYYFFKQHGSYDYYLQLEYDVVLNTSVDRLVSRAAADGVDFIGLTKGEPVQEWYWLSTFRDFYDLTDVQYKLICISLFSRGAMQALAARRLAMAGRLQRSEVQAWPFCEGFIATEMERDDFVSAELSQYVNTDTYDSWPPFVESDLSHMTDHPVIHPVLDQERYISSLLKFKVGLAGYMNVNSLFHRKLRRLPVAIYLKTLVQTFAQKAVRDMRSHRLMPR